MKTKTKRKKKYHNDKWQDEFYVTIYQLARQNMTDQSIAKALNVDRQTFNGWLSHNPAVRDALDRGRSARLAESNVNEFVHGKLPEDLQPVWDELCEIEKDFKNGGHSDHIRRRRLERIIEDKGRRAQQYLWIHALIGSNFNKSEACRKVGVSIATVRKWMDEDPKFLEISDIIPEIKRDFVEGCLLGLVGSGDTAATIFAAKTLLKDRGYDPRITVKHDHTGTVKHAHVDVDKLLERMSPQAKAELLKLLDPVSPKQLSAHLEEDDDSD